MTHKATDETRKMVQNASGLRIPHDKIATLVGITGKTLRRKYRRELNLGMAQATLAVAHALYKRCLAGDNAALFWWTKTQMGWKEDRTLELRPPPGRPLEQRLTYGSGDILADFNRRAAAGGACPAAALAGAADLEADTSPAGVD